MNSKRTASLVLAKIALGIALLATQSCSFKQEEKMHIFYLHGRIVQEQGLEAYSEEYGKYEFTQIIDSLKSIGAEVHADIRLPNTDFNTYCQDISKRVDQLLTNGIKPKNIVIIGASMGGLMAMNISTINKNPIRYILLGANNDAIEAEFDFKLHGFILGIYEKSDSLAGKNYQHWIEASEDVMVFKQLQIHSGLGHGFLYRPVSHWMYPTKNWIEMKRAIIE